jgi:rubrerythrin
MTPHHALFLALRNEERAEQYFRLMAASATNPEVRALAAEIAAEEREHVGLVRAMIAKHPPPEALWSDDPDPPVHSE